MRRKTPKRAAIDCIAAEWRREQVERIGRCELCGSRRGLIIHEIARGPSRWLAQDKKFATLVLCDPKCHGRMDEWPRPKQLALLQLSRPNDVDLDGYNRIVIRRIFQDDVDPWLPTVAAMRWNPSLN